MTLQFYLDGSLLGAGRVRIDDELALTEQADGGAVGMGVIEIDDPDGDLTVTGWMTFHVVETQCTTQRMWTGYILDRAIARGRPEHLISTARTYVCTIGDLNTNLYLRTFTQDAAKRPAETDLARITWMLAQTQCTDDSRINDNGLVNLTDNAGAFDEADYRGQYPADLLSSLAGSAVKNYYMYHDTSTGEASLFYDKPDAAVRTTSLRISNVNADVDDNTTFAPLGEVVVTRDPSTTYSGVWYGWRGGNLYVENASTEAAFIARDATYSTDRIGRLTTAQSQAAAWLAERDGEQDRILLTVRLPLNRVNEILAGHLLQAKFSHIPAYESFTWVRVVRRTVRLTGQQDPREYEVDLELSNATPVPGFSPPAAMPWQCTQVPTFVQSAREFNEVHDAVTSRTATFANLPTSGNLLVACIAVNEPSTPAGSGTVNTPAGWTRAVERDANPTSDQVGYGAIFYKVSDGTETGVTITWADASPAALWVGEYGATGATLIDTGNTWDVLMPVAWPTVNATAGQPAVIITLSLDRLTGGNNPQPSEVTERLFDDLGNDVQYNVSEDVRVGDVLTDSAAASYSFTSQGAGGPYYLVLIATFQAAGNCPAPSPGQPVSNVAPDESPDGSIANFTAPHPYATGSLRVQVQGIDVTDYAVTESDPTTGTFALDFAPLAVETVKLVYLGR